MNQKQFPIRIIIQGVTRRGSPFRPSDWAERLQGSIATYGFQNSRQLHHCMSASGMQRRPFFSHYIYITFLEGIKSLVVERGLLESNPSGYEFLLTFARDNELKVLEDWAEQELTTATSSAT